MSNFDIKRFVSVALWQYRMSMKNVLSFTVGLSFAYLGLLFTWLYPALKGGVGEGYASLMHTVEMCTLVYLITIVISGAWIFADMNGKGKLITLKMLPATDLEKYLVRLLSITLGALAAGVVAFLLADAMRIVVCLIVGVDYVAFCLPDFLAMFFTNADVPDTVAGGAGHYPAATNFLGWAWCFWAQSLYVLGGTLLRRYQFAVTSAVHAVLFVVMSVAVVFTVDDLGLFVTDERNGGLFCSVGTVFAVIALLNWWLGYKVFSRMQVINNKWINL